MSDMSPIIPTNPLDLPTTQRLLAERIERGEITQADVDLLKKGYRGMAMTTFLGGLVGIPVYIALGRRRPPPGLAVRLAAAGFMTSTGSFLGFTIGGAAAAMEVNTHMADSQRKLKVFEEIMITSKRAAEAQRIGNRSGIPADATFDATPPKMTDDLPAGVWDAEADERRREAEREREITGSDGIAQQTGSTWDRLRQQSTPRPPSQPRTSQPSTSQPRQQHPIDISSLPTQRPANPLDLNTTTQSKYSPGMSVEEKIESEAAEERRREQEAFERLLERERQVAEGKGETGFETGKW